MNRGALFEVFVGSQCDYLKGEIERCQSRKTQEAVEGYDRGLNNYLYCFGGSFI